MLAQVGSESILIYQSHGGTIAVEWKFDGSRFQIRKDGDEVSIYSRRLENVSSSLPNIIEAVLKGVQAESSILDGEVVAVGPEGRPRHFQEAFKRFRGKHDVQKVAEEIPLQLYLFDLMYLDGRGIVDLPLSERRELLVKNASREIVADEALVDIPDDARRICHAALDAGPRGHHGQRSLLPPI